MKGYIHRSLHSYFFNLFKWLNRHLLKTYSLIEDCTRCEDCGRNVHDFNVPNKLWRAIIGSPSGVYCYDCFCNRADKKFLFKWRMNLREEWTLPSTVEKIRAEAYTFTAVKQVPLRYIRSSEARNIKRLLEAQT